MSIFSEFLLNVLLFLNSITGSLGLAIIAFTIVIRSLLLPATIPSIKATRRMKEMQPELNKLKKKFGNDKQALQLAQLELYKKYNVNPLSGCLPQLVQLGVLILLYRVLVGFLGNPEFNGSHIETSFLWLDLGKPDPLYILPVAAGLSQLVLSLMIAPGAEKRDIVPNKSKKKVVREANEKEENIAEMAQSMQQQMLYIMPVFTGIIALNFPSGLALYWVATTIFSIAQQYFISGPGGLVSYAKRLTGRFASNQ
jgi:YidC/Oxa1 family membrane protein insertase